MGGTKRSDRLAAREHVAWLAMAAVVLLSAGMQGAVVQHVTDHSSGWYGGTSIAANWCKLQNWSGTADGTLGEFDHTALQSEVDSAMGSYGGYNAKVIVTQVSWITDPIPGDLAPVAVSVDVDTGTLVWGSSKFTNAGSGSWRYDGVAYANFVAAVNAGVANGDSMVVAGAPWQAVWDTSLPVACWNIEIDVPESYTIRTPSGSSWAPRRSTPTFARFTAISGASRPTSVSRSSSRRRRLHGSS